MFLRRKAPFLPVCAPVDHSKETRVSQPPERLQARKRFPLRHAGWLLLPLYEILVQAAFGAKLLLRKPMSDKTEFAITDVTARRRFHGFTPSLVARHRQASPGNRAPCPKTIGGRIASNSSIASAAAIFSINLTC
jgi:hypothetical protein